MVATYIAGECVGGIFQIFTGDRLGRLRLMQLMCIIVTIGTVLQTAAVNFGMFLAGRILAGMAVGFVDTIFYFRAILTSTPEVSLELFPSISAKSQHRTIEV